MSSSAAVKKNIAQKSAASSAAALPSIKIDVNLKVGPEKATGKTDNDDKGARKRSNQH